MDVFGYKIHIFHISCVIALFSFITLFESVFHGINFALVFIPKFLVSVTFVRIMSAPALFLLTVIYCENCEYEIFEYYALLLFFFRKSLSLQIAKIDLNYKLQLLASEYQMQSRRGCPVKNVFLRISQKSQKNTCARVSFLITLQASGNFIKREALAQVFSYEFSGIFKNTFFIEHHRWLLVEYVFIWIIFCYFVRFPLLTLSMYLFA